ncbi:universal stress protein [Arthrobacter sp. H20]|uniref:universal stress protein n=1 Tax=Arthrobacter sp. H20 TaxID=1267981 RepID=UPI00047E6A9B|nr:universal stress protein [Arthrobacter sp. H20]
MKESIVVGYDGSDQSRLALRWAAAQAVLEERTLHVVHGWIWPLLTHDLGPVEGIADSGIKHAAEAVLSEGEIEANRLAPGLDVKTSLISGVPSEVLARTSQDAHLVTVGSRGLGGFLGLLVGSVSLKLATTAHCPVAVVRAKEASTGPVLIGVDGSPKSETALDDAIALAALWRAPLKIMHVRDDVRLFGRNHSYPGSDVLAMQILSAAVLRARAAVSDLEIEPALVTGHSVPGTILNAAASARIVVVGETGQGKFIGAVGSTAQAILHHAKGNILISRHPGN